MAVDGKFSLILSPQAAPGTCAGCGRATDNLGFIDTDFQADYYGAVIYCSECILDMASKFGYITPAAADALREQVRLLQIEVSSQRAAILGLEDTVDGLLRVRESGASTITSDVESEPISEPEVTEETSAASEYDLTSGLSEDSESDATDGNSEVDDLISVPVPAGISGDIGDFTDLDF